MIDAVRQGSSWGRALSPALLLVLALGWPGVALAASQALPAASPARLQVVASAGRTLLDAPVRPGGRWCLVWNHSVTGIRVADCYRFQNGRMLLERSHQPDFAAGLGHIPGRGVQTSDGQGGYWIEHIDEPVPGNRYLLRVGSNAVNHRILLDGNATSLSALAAGERVTIQLRASRQPPP